MIATRPVPARPSQVFYLLGDLALASMADLVPSWVNGCSWLILLLPATIVVLGESSRSGALRVRQGLSFSITHAVFFAACLYRLSYRFAAFPIFLWWRLHELLDGSLWLTTLCATTGYFAALVLIAQVPRCSIAASCSEMGRRCS